MPVNNNHNENNNDVSSSFTIESGTERKFVNTPTGDDIAENQDMENPYAEEKGNPEEVNPDDSRKEDTIWVKDNYMNTPGCDEDEKVYTNDITPSGPATEVVQEEESFRLFHDDDEKLFTNDKTPAGPATEVVQEEESFRLFHDDDEKLFTNDRTPDGPSIGDSKVNDSFRLPHDEEKVFINGVTPMGEENSFRLDKKEEKVFVNTPKGEERKNEKPVKNQDVKPVKNLDAKKLDKFLYALKSEIDVAKGFFHDSDQYQDFDKAVQGCRSLAFALAESQKRGRAFIKLKALNNFAAEYMHYEYHLKKNQVMKGDTVSLETAQDMLNKYFGYVQQCAQKYVDYKMADHTNDPISHPDMKKLNSDDRRKLSIMNKVLPKSHQVELDPPKLVSIRASRELQ